MLKVLNGEKGRDIFRNGGGERHTLLPCRPFRWGFFYVRANITDEKLFSYSFSLSLSLFLSLKKDSLRCYIYFPPLVIVISVGKKCWIFFFVTLFFKRRFVVIF